MSCGLLLALVLAGSSRGEMRGPAAEPVLRIGLVKTFGAADSLYASVGGAGKLAVDVAGGKSIRGPGLWRVTRGESGGVVVRGEDGEAVLRGGKVCLLPGEAPDSETVGISLSSPGPDPGAQTKLSSRGRAGRQRESLARYRGSLEIFPGPKEGLLAVNIVPLENYVRGVVRLEIGADAPMEAIKAQAVAARTYALKSRGRFAKQGYDLTDTTICQAYGGVEAESAITDSAVRDTRGFALVLGRNLILADYYDDCGGVTAPGDDAADFPPSVVDRPENRDEDYCQGGRYHTWRLEMTADEAGRIARSLSGWPRDAKLSEMQVSSTDMSGRVVKVRITARDGAVKEVRATAFRAATGYERLKSTLFRVHKVDDGFMFEGRGYGHGRGMCQSGAIGMAAQPYNRSYREILSHYFPGAAVETWTDSTAADGRNLLK